MERREDADLSVVRAVAAAALAVTPEHLEVGRTEHGVAGQVYRLARGGDEWFLRLGDEREDNLEVDATLHQRLSDLGVSVPTVVYFASSVEELGRSALMTRHIGGVPLLTTPDHESAAEVARAAGRDLALINQVGVDGFGWIRRDHKPGAAIPWPLAAELPTYRSFVVDDLPRPWPGGLADLFDLDELARLEAIITAEQECPVADASLAHGDLCLEHIFHLEGRYTGIIDFGEIRGTEPYFDLGVFLPSGAHTHTSAFRGFRDGYFEVTAEPNDADALIRTAGLLKALRHLGMWLQPTFTLERDKIWAARRIATRLLPAAEHARRGEIEWHSK